MIPYPKRVMLSLCPAVLMAAFAGEAPAQFDWGSATPESQGMSGTKLGALRDNLSARGTTAFLVIRNDKVVAEGYASGYGRATKHYTASKAKALVGGVSLAVAMSDGRIAPDDLAAKYVPQWVGVNLKSQIKVRHLGSHTSGIEDAEEGDKPHDQLTGWKGDFWKRLAVPNDPFTVSRDKAPVLFAPGTNSAYSNPGIAMLTYAVTGSLKSAPVKDVRTLLRDRVMRPIGVPDGEWNCGYGQTFTVDGLPLVPSWGGGNYSPNASARVARLMLRKGNWEGTQLIGSAAVQAVTSDAGTPGNGAQGWWTNSDGTAGTLPKDAFYGAGAGHQVVLAIPSLNLIAVRDGETLDSSLDYNAALRKHFFDPLMAAVNAAPPYPASAAITGIAWAPASSIVRKAQGSDTWPLTWADDDHLYGAYGDGNGFEPFVSSKLSLGFARVEGPAAGFAGYNIRSASGEQAGDGAAGKKASGMLMVGGTLYMWVRNADNNGRQSQLAWSADRARTWTWSAWKFAEFGYPTFVNFGKNYAGARDGTVYTVSHDHPSAYEKADRFVLMRVPADRLKERASYEFFKGRDSSGNPLWTTDIAQRGAVFTHPGRCRRSQMTYNAGLKRYLWWQMLHEDGVDNRFAGGFGVYDAPEPWGPWTTVCFTSSWDVGPGETGSFPAKWMSADGKTIHLVFSGEDCFSVRQATLTAVPSGNSAPSPRITTPSADGQSFAAGSTLSFSGGATDPEDGALAGGSLTWHIDRIGDGFAAAKLPAAGTSGSQVLSGSVPNPSGQAVQLDVVGSDYDLILRATDSKGATAEAKRRYKVSTATTFSVSVDYVSTGKAYGLSTAGAGALYYIDRSYTIGSVSTSLVNQTMIRTANDDKAVTAGTHLKFTVTQPALVYVGYDKRATTLPAWLNDGTWTFTAESLAVSDAGASPMRVYSKSAGSGQVTLGGNKAGGGAGAQSNYVVVVRRSGAAKANLYEALVPEGTIPADVWEHEGDADGDGLRDGFEAAQDLDPQKADSDGDGEMDETELAADGRTLWEAQGEGAPSSDGEGGGDGGGCGATGAEVLILLAFMRRGRRGR